MRTGLASLALALACAFAAAALMVAARPQGTRRIVPAAALLSAALILIVGYRPGTAFGDAFSGLRTVADVEYYASDQAVAAALTEAPAQA